MRRRPVLQIGDMVAIPTDHGMEHGRLVGVSRRGILVRYDSVESSRVVVVSGQVLYIPRARLPRAPRRSE